ncbi:MAG: M48 family metallopeptidase [Pseudomonadales bacterium]|nr:M48 family metallopeptidase [Pseudomonadales bacterium]
MVSLFNSIEKLFNPDRAELCFDYSIVRSNRRKTLCIQIKRGEVRVLAPSHYPQRQIEQFIRAKAQWINEKLLLQSSRSEQLQPLQDGSQLLCRGQIKTLKVLSAKAFSLIETEQQLCMYIPVRVKAENRHAYIKRQLGSWFQGQALQYLPQRLAQLSQQTKLQPGDWQIKQYKARWGSCNSKGLIRLNYLLMMTPDFVIDYVLIHELCHLKQMNHSAKFWALVNSHCPDYPLAKQWLKQHNALLQAFHQ